MLGHDEEGRGEEGVTLAPVVGIDLGATRIRAALVSADGRILARTESRTDAGRGPTAVLSSLTHVISEVLGQSLPDQLPVHGIGLAVAGQVHPRTHAVVAAPNLGWRDVGVVEDLQTRFGMPVWVENDVRAAAWGEYRFGRAAGAGSLVAVFVGSGVGSGAVLGGALWRGAGNAAGEVGHTQVVHDGLPCPCGQRGCMEQYASGRGFQRRFADALASGVRTRLVDLARREPTHLTARMVFEAARDGDGPARELWADAERYLTMSLANYMTVVNPEVLVLGGGVVETVPELFGVVAAGITRLTTEMSRAVLRIERAALGDWSGVVGAADLLRAA